MKCGSSSGANLLIGWVLLASGSVLGQANVLETQVAAAKQEAHEGHPFSGVERRKLLSFAAALAVVPFTGPAGIALASSSISKVILVCCCNLTSIPKQEVLPMSR